MSWGWIRKSVRLRDNWDWDAIEAMKRRAAQHGIEEWERMEEEKRQAGRQENKRVALALKEELKAGISWERLQELRKQLFPPEDQK